MPKGYEVDHLIVQMVDSHFLKNSKLRNIHYHDKKYYPMASIKITIRLGIFWAAKFTGVKS